MGDAFVQPSPVITFGGCRLWNASVRSRLTRAETASVARQWNRSAIHPRGGLLKATGAYLILQP